MALPPISDPTSNALGSDPTSNALGSDPTSNASGSQTKPTVVVLGTVGHGKSNFLNRLAGEDIFESAKKVKSVTLVSKMFENEDFKMIDTPGLNDKRIDTKDWVDSFNDSASP